MGSRPLPNLILISFCAFFVFFLGLLWFPGLIGKPYDGQIISFIIIFTLIIILSFYSRQPLNGVLISLFFAIAFLCGHITSVYARLLFFSHGWIGDPRLTPNEYITRNWEDIISLQAGSGSLLGILSAVLGLASLGLLAGLIGYIFDNLLTESPESYPHIFRDYWSQVFDFKKSHAREYKTWDQRLAGWSIIRGSWIQRIRQRLREPRQEFIFQSNSDTKGELLDISSNKIVGDTELWDYKKLISQYIPKLTHDPAGIANLIPVGNKKIRTPPAFRELLGKLAISIAQSSFTIIFFVFLTLIVSIGPAIYSFFVIGDFYITIMIFLGTGIPSITTFVIAIGFREKSKSLLVDRPDEGAFIFFVFLCLFSIYPIIFFILFNQPSTFFYEVPNSWVFEWFWGWTFPFLFLSGILGLGYILIHRETENINVYFFDNRSEEVDPGLVPFKNPKEKPHWLDELQECPNPDPQNKEKTILVKTKFYWVIRFMYCWRAEVTLHKRLKIIPILKLDWERVELWIDAEKGVLKWVVSDYHYREAWYKIENPYLKKLPDLFVNICPNFHTPIPIVNHDDVELYSKAMNASKKELTKRVFEGIIIRIVHPFRWLFSSKYRKDREKAKAEEENVKDSINRFVEEEDVDMYEKVLKKLECTHVRYVKGVDNKELYKTELAYDQKSEEKPVVARARAHRRKTLQRKLCQRQI